MEELVLKYVLQNAVRYNGKANAGAIIGKILNEKPELKSDIKNISKKIIEVVKKINSIKFEEQLRQLQELAPGLLEKREEIKELHELPNASKTMVFRLAPYPSGALHIGNVKTYLLNALYAEKYRGKTYLIFDDTIGSEEKQIVIEAYFLIQEGFDWLSVKYEKIFYKSDRLKIYYKYAEEIIKKGLAYVCSCPVEILRENRAKGVECGCRNSSVKENLENWKKMFRAKEGSLALRIKTDMQHKNPAFRDRVLFRISDRIHPRIGKKYRVWPMLEFSWAVDDYLLGITHIIRGKDLMMETEMCNFIWDIFRWKKPTILHAGLVKLEGDYKLSKSKAQKEVKEGTFTGWDDPRTLSVQSLRRRGFRPEAIRSFIFNIGLNQNDITVPIDILYAENKKLVESSNRYFFVEKPIKIRIDGFKGREVKVPLHPDFPERNYRRIKAGNEFYIPEFDFRELKENRLYRLMDCLNFRKKGNKYVFDSEDYESFRKNGERTIHWLPVNGNVDAEIVMDDGSIKKGIVESNCRDMKINETCQFERQFFAKLDKKEKNKLVFWFTHK